jgi:hypothetical protein
VQEQRLIIGGDPAGAVWPTTQASVGDAAMSPGEVQQRVRSEMRRATAVIDQGLRTG